MRLLQIITLLDSYRVFLRELTKAIRDDGHEVLTLCHTGEGNAVAAHESAAECQSFKLPRGASPFKYYQSASELRKVIKRFNPDIVHAHFSAAILIAALARVGGSCNAQWIGTFQGIQFPFLHGFRRTLTRQAEAFAAGRMDKVWVLTEEDAKMLGKAAPRAKISVQTSPGFGCAERFVEAPAPDEGTRITLRREAGFFPGEIVFLFIGRLVAFKGFHLATRAFFEAYKQAPHLRFVVIGERDQLHPSGLCSEEWQTFHSHPAIQYLGTKNDVLPWLDCCDALLFPSSREGMSVSVMEALARRLPVLTNRVRGCQELIQEGISGTFFPSSTVAAIRDILLHFEPYRHKATIDHLRRSHWIKEMKNDYDTSQSGSGILPLIK